MPPTADQHQDVADFLIPIIREAEHQADLVNAFLEALGIVPHLEQRLHNPVPLPADLLLKLAALVRLYQWEKTGLRPHLPANLPSAREVLEDVLGVPRRKRPRFSGCELAKIVLKTHLTQMAWTGLSGLQSDVAITQTVSPEQTLDLVAHFLWQFRHLGK
jgi:hypothetical protein